MSLAKVNNTWDNCKAKKPNVNRTLAKVNRSIAKVNKT
jgi:hypothetical protein